MFWATNIVLSSFWTTNCSRLPIILDSNCSGLQILFCHRSGLPIVLYYQLFGHRLGLPIVLPSSHNIHQTSTCTYVDRVALKMASPDINVYTYALHGLNGSVYTAILESSYYDTTMATLQGDLCVDNYSVPRQQYDTWRDVKFWSLAFIIPIGLVFNFMSLAVYLTSWMCRGVPGRYFIALAFADNLVLLGELLLWLNTQDAARGPKIGIRFYNSMDFFCKSLNALRYGSRMWSSWLTVAITVERFLTVTFPMVRISSPRKAVIIILAIGIICFLFACFPFFTLEAKPYLGAPLCQFSNRRLYTLLTVIFIAVVGELVLPSLIVSVFTALIIWRLAIARRERMRMVESQASSSGWRQRASHMQPTIALVCIAIMFVTIRMPYVIMFFVNEYKEKMWQCLDRRLSFRIYVVYTVSMIMAVLNYALNFCLYCVSGSSFRKEVRRCLRCRRHNRQLTMGASTVTTTPVYGRDPSTREFYSYMRQASPGVSEQGCDCGPEKVSQCPPHPGTHSPVSRRQSLGRRPPEGSNSENHVIMSRHSCSYGTISNGQTRRNENASSKIALSSFNKHVIDEQSENANIGLLETRERNILVVIQTSPNGVVTRL